MAEVRAFHGLRYNPMFVDDMADVICPPYDIISPEQEKALKERSPYNYIRLEYSQPTPQDNIVDNRYTRAAAILEKWIGERVMTAEKKAAIYIHDHYFSVFGKQYKRRGIIARVRLEEWDRMVIRPHEGTLAEPKRDRINLISAVRANTSPVYGLYQDTEKDINRVLEIQTGGKPTVSMNIEGERHELWVVTDESAISKVTALFDKKPVCIADGHHRYESALTYRRERLAGNPQLPSDDPVNFVMMTLVDFADPGLVVLPAHRLLGGMDARTLSNLQTKLASFFDVTTIPAKLPAAWDTLDKAFKEEGKIRLVMYGLGGTENFTILTLRDLETASKLMPYFHSDIYKKLDVSILDHIILEELMGLKTVEDPRIAFNFDRNDVVSRIKSGEFQLAFILKPMKAEVIKAISDVSDRMPRKSTYFFPKLPSGLVVYRFESEAIAKK
ncbi:MULTISPECIES: DUF1015 domain-containing protein [Dehalococcoides]|uniref:DUF1015 domain-containing protein n=1 Tax=Dehalococcoides TaxID=61434 RepID=UPI0002B76DB2|nr:MULTISPECIES: DUF1015 domain-containing protein [Dehalococcoides]AGG06232.1 hypothetical protein dcmb_605 [Dehalococcoides mccartyi DCMB5]